jgi:hypothetical protein
MQVVESVALDSVPPSRRKAYEYLRTAKGAAVSTPIVAEAMALPTVTTRRVLEELTAYQLIGRESQGQGKPDLWKWLDWESEGAPDDPQNDEEAQ